MGLHSLPTNGVIRNVCRGVAKKMLDNRKDLVVFCDK